MATPDPYSSEQEAAETGHRWEVGTRRDTKAKASWLEAKEETEEETEAES